MYYVWDLKTSKSTRFFCCRVPQFEKSSYLKLNYGEKIVDKIPIPLQYWTDVSILPEDYPMTSTGKWVLISDKIKKIFEGLGVDNIEYFESEIIVERKNKEIKVIKGYWTINILNIQDCVDMGKTEISSDGYKIYKIKINQENIDKKFKVFLIKINYTKLKVVHKDVIDAFIKEGVTGVKFTPIEEYEH